MLKKSVVAITAFSIIAAGTAFAAAVPQKTSVAADEQCYKAEQLITLDKQKVAGGQGTLYGKFAFVRTAAAPEQAIKEIGWMTLKPGASIGSHKHYVNEDTYIIISGHGVFTDEKGVKTEVSKGDITIARPGQSHALANNSREPLVFLDVIAQNDSYQQNHPNAQPKK